MKKLLALVFALVMVVSFSVTALALDSVTTDTADYYVVEVTNGVSGTAASAQSVSVEKGGTLGIKASATKGTFNSWSFYVLVNGVYKEAVEGVDYVFVSGDKTASEIKVTPLVANLKVAGNYNGVTTDPKVAFASSTSTTTASPKTGDMVAGLVLAMMAVAACVVVSKKQLAK